MVAKGIAADRSDRLPQITWFLMVAVPIVTQILIALHHIEINKVCKVL